MKYRKHDLYKLTTPETIKLHAKQMCKNIMDIFSKNPDDKSIIICKVEHD